MIKRVLLFLCAFLFILSLSVSADGFPYAITPYGEFYSFSEYPDKVADITGVEKQEIGKFITDNSIEYIAVNSDNSAQIQLTVLKTDFSEKIKNLTALSDSEIKEIIPQITGIDGCNGKIVTKDGQKFLKTELKSSDSGGDFFFTEYITVADGKSCTLSFSSSEDMGTEYIEKTFATFTSADFLNTSGNTVFKVIIPAAIGLFVLVSVCIILSVIKDLKKRQNDSSDSEQP